jgi:5'-nucleotidase
MSVILLDVDDTVAQLEKEWIRRYNADYGDNLTIDEITGWDMLSHIKPECGEKIFDYLLDPELYNNVEIMPGALEAVKELREQGDEIYFVTAGYSPGKLAWLQFKTLLPMDYTGAFNYIVCHAKHLIQGDILVDDRPSTIEGFPGFGILFDRPWNQSFKWPYRAKDWKEALGWIRLYKLNALDTEREVIIPEAMKQPVLIPGLGPDAPMVVGEGGGRQSGLPYAFHLIDPQVLFRLAYVVAEGAEDHGLWNWRKIPIDDNLNHALAHILAYLAGDAQDDHLGHAFCRLHFALSLDITPGYSPRMDPS